MLSGNRVLDLTDEKGFLCGTILAGLGADVIKVERPGGDASRNIGPFYHDTANAEKSLYWFAYNINKRGITLNIELTDGQEIFKRLVKSADFVVESFPVRHMESLGLGHEALSKINPRLVMTSITPFGQTGPHRDYKTSDVVSVAEGGLLYLNGDSDRPPVRITAPQAYLLAGAQAAAGTMVAYYSRELLGKGQWVDVSIQESVVSTVNIEATFWEYTKEVVRRGGPVRRRGGRGVYSRAIWPCKDGHVSLVLLYGRYGERLQRLVGWMDREGMAGILKDVENWNSFDMSKLSSEQTKAIEETILIFLSRHTKAELREFALKERIYMTPGNTPKEIREDLQLASRDFWVPVEHPELGTTIDYPANIIGLKERPWRIKRRAPLVGEHNEEVYLGEMGIPRVELITLKQAGVV